MNAAGSQCVDATQRNVLNSALFIILQAIEMDPNRHCPVYENQDELL